ncbi:MAG: CO dehydrogenase/CO-methylating acetyl-CoA synthase complex subunit beta [Candidatus Aminicenantes bacterium RBG_19FT_COMBO_58_17]|jgi:acetyl-CoA synthase|nr:MAG: CO dehydrogenase/CO-methylating acetyl-CoA synthase complex subunit beta [Candidatus Aminicenantes bacterium RBG_19FT_COMBO_58_17]HCS49254.1 CO dehydrogenase/CO-methylating acetyl-CoA synthase complex subunit beta [Candidatus Aminicenantes bacterium]
MSRIIATRAIRGAHKLVARAERELAAAIAEMGPDTRVEFPNTGYYLPISHGILGLRIETLGGLRDLLAEAKELLPPVPSDNLWLPYLGNTLDAGMATLFADEIIEAIKYTRTPLPYLPETHPKDGRLWLGAANDVIMRERGIEFVDNTAPGFAACVGYCPTNEIAVRIARELQEKNLYVFMSAATDGKSMAQQLAEEGIEMGWETRLVPFGDDVTATIHALGFSTRVALSFGGAQPGDYQRVLRYNKNRVFAFVLALGPVDDEKHAQAAGAINYGFPTIADTDIDNILPTGICTYEHVVSPVPHDRIVSKAIEVRGLKISVTKVPIPVPFGPAFQGERIRKEDMYVELAGTEKHGFEYLTGKGSDEVEDGKIEVVGPEIDEVTEGSQLPLALWVEVAGRQMQPDFEPILERRLHDFMNMAHGVFHMGQRDINWVRVSKEAKDQGFRFRHFGSIIHAKIHGEFGKIVDKVQVKIYTREKEVMDLIETARKVYRQRDERLAGLTDEAVETFYSCTLCQSFAPNHVCVITPERSGLCGAYNWLDGKAAHQINPTGPNQPILKAQAVDAIRGQWQGINEFVFNASHKTLQVFSAYSIIDNPMTSCGCFECISCVLPSTNGIMTVYRNFPGMTPSGMKFSTLAGTVGGGLQTPGFIGHSKRYVASSKFISAEGGAKRVVWMNRELKEELEPDLRKIGRREGVENLFEMIADETVAVTEEEVLAHITKMNHPALSMPPLF